MQVLQEILSYQMEKINIASPNPFSNYTKFTKPDKLPKNAILKIYNTNGQLITILNFDNIDEIIWNGSDSQNRSIPNGLYFYNIYDEDNFKGYSGKILYHN